MLLISSLPAEIIQLIFSFLSEEELLCSVSYVCKEWNRISMDGFLWKDLARTPNLCHSNENRTYPPPDFSVPLKEWKQIFYDLGSVCNPNEQVYLIKDALEASSKDTVDQVCYFLLFYFLIFFNFFLFNRMLIKL